MKTISILKGEEIKAISTKFYYKGKKLCYKIILSYGAAQSNLFKEYDHYDIYQKDHDNLVTAINNCMDIFVNFNSVEQPQLMRQAC